MYLRFIRDSLHVVLLCDQINEKSAFFDSQLGSQSASFETNFKETIDSFVIDAFHIWTLVFLIITIFLLGNF